MYAAEMRTTPIGANVLQNRLARIVQTEIAFDIDSITTAGPQGGPLDIGSGNAFLVVRTGAIYSLSVRAERPAAETANCLTRLAFGGRRVVAELDLDIQSDMLKNFDPIRFDLQPGLYRIFMLFGRWRDQHPIGPGKATLMIAQPGETLQPATGKDLVRMEQRPAPSASSVHATDRLPTTQ
jgi:hypothetical protein